MNECWGVIGDFWLLVLFLLLLLFWLLLIIFWLLNKGLIIVILFVCKGNNMKCREYEFKVKLIIKV